MLALLRSHTVRAVLQFYMAMFHAFHEEWITTGATMATMHYVMESVELACRRNPAAAVSKCVRLRD